MSFARLRLRAPHARMRPRGSYTSMFYNMFLEIGFYLYANCNIIYSRIRVVRMLGDFSFSMFLLWRNTNYSIFAVEIWSFAMHVQSTPCSYESPPIDFHNLELRAPGALDERLRYMPFLALFSLYANSNMSHCLALVKPCFKMLTSWDDIPTPCFCCICEAASIWRAGVFATLHFVRVQHFTCHNISESVSVFQNKSTQFYLARKCRKLSIKRMVINIDAIIWTRLLYKYSWPSLEPSSFWTRPWNRYYIANTLSLSYVAIGQPFQIGQVNNLMRPNNQVQVHNKNVALCAHRHVIMLIILRTPELCNLFVQTSWRQILISCVLRLLQFGGGGGGAATDDWGALGGGGGGGGGGGLTSLEASQEQSEWERLKKKQEQEKADYELALKLQQES